MAHHHAAIASDADYPSGCQWDVVKATNHIRMHKNLPKLTPGEFWDKLPHDFWASIPFYPLAKIFLVTLETFGDVYIATSPTLSTECVSGKYDWFRFNLPRYFRKHYIGADKTAFASRDTVLIDDRDKNCKDFVQAGGQAILVPRPWNNGKDIKGHPYDFVIDNLRSL